jgi:hypothetical protein
VSDVTESAEQGSMRCPHCHCAARPGPFCGRCGAHLTPRPGDGPAWLRPDGLFAAPHESVFRPSLASSLLPQLSEFTRRPFNAGLLLIIIAMAVLVELQLPGGLITVASLGLPMLLVIYWRRSRVFDDIPRWSLWVAVLLAVALGVGWVLLTDDLMIRHASSPFEAGAGGRRALRQGLAVSDGAAIVMLVPLVAARLLWWRKRRESLEGFVIGVLSSLMFTAAVTLTRLAPQFVTTPVARNQPVRWLFYEAAVRGVTVPLAAACFGGLIGAGLWFNRPRTYGRFSQLTVVALLLGFSLAILAVYAAVGRADVEGTSQLAVLSWHVAMAVFALIALRVGLQLAVLPEETPAAPETPLLCLHCRQVVPEMAFCPSCGAATRASPARSREERRQVTPDDGDIDSAGATVWPGYDVPARTYTATKMSRQSPIPVLGIWLAGMVALSAIFIGLPALTVKPQARYNCPPECGTPPSGEAVSTNPRFSGAGGLYTVAYPAPGGPYDVNSDDAGITAKYLLGDGGELRLMGEPAKGRSAREVAKAFIAAKFPTANKAYEIPNAMVGFEPGYGEVADVFPLNLDTSSVRMRMVVIVAAKNDVALIASAFGPFHQFGPDFGPGRPSPANLQIAQDMGRYVNSFEWTGRSPA